MTFFRLTPNKELVSSGGGFNAVEPPIIDFANSDDGWLSVEMGRDGDGDEEVECTSDSTAAK